MIEIKSSYRHEGTQYFRRFVKEARRISPHIRIKRINHGFYRVYYKNFYIGECYKEMPIKGYDLYDIDARFEDKKFCESKEDRGELTRKVKNYVEGYVEAYDMLKTNMYLLRHSKEHHDEAQLAMEGMKVL